MKQTGTLSSIFILTRSLNVGGAERQVSILAQALHKKGYQVTVGVFYSGGVLEQELKKSGVAVYSLHKKGRWDLIAWFYRYVKAIREVNPDVIYSFLTTSNIIALIGQLFVSKPVVWGIRASNMQLDNYDWLARLTGFIEKRFARFANITIFNSKSSLVYHEAIGYRFKKAIVIPNGIDTDFFKPSAESRNHFRKQLGIPQDAVLVGMLARYDPMKDYETYIAAAQMVCEQHKNVYFIAAGQDTDLVVWTGMSGHFRGLGVCNDVSGLLNTLDLLVLSSAFGEGFPNVIGEAMACGVPAIATDVGDARYILSDLGIIIPPRNPEALKEAIIRSLKERPSKEELRQRIKLSFSVALMVDRTVQILEEACGLV